MTPPIALGTAGPADRAGQAPTLRAVTVYGDDPADAGLTVDQARAANALGRTVLTLDEAGQVTTAGYDLDGNPLTVTRRVLAPRPAAIHTARTRQNRTAGPAPATPWTGSPPRAKPTPAHADTLLDPAEYQVDARWDALGRKTSQTAPTDATGARSRFGYTYGRRGGITAITLDDAPYLQTASYDPHGRRLFAQLGNGAAHPLPLRPSHLPPRPAAYRPRRSTCPGQLAARRAGAARPHLPLRPQPAT